MNKTIISILIGSAVGLLDITPMIIKKLDRMFILSAFFMWLLSGVVTANFTLSGMPVLNGLLISLMFFIPLSFLIYRLDQDAFLQVAVTTVLLGCLLGFVTGKLIR